MNSNIYLIRHAKTKGNYLKQYIGVTDEPLCEKGIEELGEKKISGCYPRVDYVYTSPMRRCCMTRKILYKDIPFEVVPEFTEYNFGDFEGKTYDDLKDRAEYRAWIDSGGIERIPGGEDFFVFKQCCCLGFENIVTKVIANRLEDTAIILHGGIIMAILEKYSENKSDFYSWQIKNCEGYKLNIDNDLWVSNKKIREITKIV